MGRPMEQMSLLHNEGKETDTFSSLLWDFKEQLDGASPGQNLLIEYGNKISLIKYEGFEETSLDPLNSRISRDTNVYCIGNLLMPEDDNPYSHKDIEKRIVEKLRVDVLGSHRLVLTKDEEFNFYLVNSDIGDFYFTIANKYGDGRVKKTFEGDCNIITNEAEIWDKLQNITRENYFNTNISPFLHNESTDLNISENVSKKQNLKTLINNFLTFGIEKEDQFKPSYLSFDRFEGIRWLNNLAQELNHGDFVYVGSKEEVYLLGIAKNEINDMIEMQGTEVASTKPMLWFSNKYLGDLSNVEYEGNIFDANPPKLGEKPFVFNAMGRSQNHRNRIFSGEPEIITANIEHALSHFKTTDFSEFRDIVELYAQEIREPTPGAKTENGREYFT